MDYIGVLLNRVEIMFILIMFGFVLKKCGFLEDEMQKQLSVLMLKIFTSLASFASFATEYTKEKVQGVLMALGIGLVIASIEVILALTIFKNEKYCVESFALGCGNVGFFGMPIVLAVLGSDAVMYISVLNCINSILIWTFGEYVLSKDVGAIKPLNAIKNPVTIALFFGLIFFFFQIPLPSIIKECITSMNNVNAPMCALMIGASLVKTDIKEIKNDYTNFLCSLLRLVVVPFLAIVLMKFVSNDYLTMKLAILIGFSVPNAGTTPVFALRHNKDADKAGRLTCVCSILSVITMPLMSNIALHIWGI